MKLDPVNPCQLALATTRELEMVLFHWLGKLPDVQRRAVRELLANNKGLVSDEGHTLRTWSMIPWLTTAPVWNTIRTGLLDKADPKSYRWVRIGEEIADMEAVGEFHGPPYFLGYQRRVMFFDLEEKARYLIGGGNIE
jgi:hypothetical protein